MTLADMKFLTSFINMVTVRPLVVAMKLMEEENHCYISGAFGVASYGAVGHVPPPPSTSR